jgi:16S rRNA processing protein RimM
LAVARVCLGVITGAHGVRGLVRVKPFTEDPADVAAYGEVADEEGARHFRIEATGRTKGGILARIEGIGDRDQAEALAGTRLYVDRAALPAIADEDTYYQTDLIGLAAEDPEGRPLGRVAAVHNFGAGDVLELETPGPAAGGQAVSVLIPFTRGAVPSVDLERGRVIVDLPAESGARPPEDSGVRDSDERQDDDA